MRPIGVLSAILLLAAPVAAFAQPHGGMGGAGVRPVSMTHGASWGPGFGPSRAGHGESGRDGLHSHRFDRHGDGAHDHEHGLWWGWGPYWGWGWPDCGPDGDACDWGYESSPGAPSDDYGYTDGPSVDAACGAWLRHGAGYVWTRRVCGDPPPADPPAHAAVASSECSDWVWRAELHRSVCKRISGAG